MRRSFAVAAAAVVIGVGSGTAVGVARSGSTPSTHVSGAPSTTTPKSGANESARQHDRGGRLERVLDELVAKGTITQSQADAITNAMKDARPEGRGGPHGDGFGFFRSAEKVNAAIAKELGITPNQLRDERRAGKSLAQIGQEHGVTAQRLVDVIVRTISASIDEAVSRGHMTAQQAAQAKARLTEFVTKLVNATRNGGGLRPPRDFGRNWGGGPGADQMPPSSLAPPTTRPSTHPAPTSSTPSSTAPSRTVPSSSLPTSSTTTD